MFKVLGLRDYGSGFSVQCSVFIVHRGSRVQGLRFKVTLYGLRI